MLAKTLRCVDESLADAKLNANQIDKVILVGGASRTPLVHELLEEQLGQPVHFEVDPDLCVAMGAAVQGGLIAGVDVGPVLVDITPHTLGIRVVDEIDGRLSHDCFARLIARNSPLPSSHSKIFYTGVDGQDAARIAVFQGEDDDVRHNDPVGEFLLEGLANVNQGNEILVRFDLDLDGILKVTATERGTGRQQQLTIDNAVAQFRARNREEALARVGAMFEPGPQRGSGRGANAPAAAGGELPAEMAELTGRCEALIAKSEKLAESSNPTDAAEMRQLAQRLRTAMAQQSQAEIESVAAQLEDLAFYLQDA